MRSQPAAIIRDGAGVRVLWAERDRTIANELSISRPAIADLNLILAHLVELDEASWAKLVNQVGLG